MSADLRDHWEPVDEHAEATAIANAIHRDAIPEEERGYFLALIGNHVATCATCAEMRRSLPERDTEGDGA